jgi:uncharacterized protein (DUF1697 family)
MLKSMTVVVALLRAVNVGGHNRISMDALRGICERLGFANPRTYLQSGNIVFETGEKSMAALVEKLEGAIHRRFGFRVRVIVRTGPELKKAVGQNPLANRRDTDPRRLLVIFLEGAPSPEARAKLLSIDARPEEFHVIDREVYVYYPNGLARPKLAPALIEKTLATSGTGRNWNTVTKLLQIAEELGPGGTRR